MLYITERCVFQLTADGMELVEIAPGIDLQRDILAHMDFQPVLKQPPQLMDGRIFQPEPMGPVFELKHGLEGFRGSGRVVQTRLHGFLLCGRHRGAPGRCGIRAGMSSRRTANFLILGVSMPKVTCARAIAAVRIAQAAGVRVQPAFRPPGHPTLRRTTLQRRDFLALSGKYSGFPVEFTYAWPSVITPVGIGLINGARNPEGGKAFIAFTLSEPGQRLLLRPEIRRLPVLPRVSEAGDRPPDYPKLVDVARSYLPAYAADVSDSRYQMVGALFDQSITFRHRELAAITRSIHDVAEQLRRTPDAAAAELLDRARVLVYRAPIPENDELLSRKPLKTRQQITAIASREAEWARQTDRNLATARAWLAQAREQLAAATGASVERRDTP